MGSRTWRREQSFCGRYRMATEPGTWVKDHCGVGFTGPERTLSSGEWLGRLQIDALRY